MQVLKGIGLLKADEAEERVGLPQGYLEANDHPPEVGFLFAEDPETGERYTHLADARWVHTLQESSIRGLIDEELLIPPEAHPLMTPGWPDDWEEITRYERPE